MSKLRKLEMLFVSHTLTRMRQGKLAEGLEVDLQELRKKHELVVTVAGAAHEEVVELGRAR